MRQEETSVRPKKKSASAEREAVAREQAERGSTLAEGGRRARSHRARSRAGGGGEAAPLDVKRARRRPRIARADRDAQRRRDRRTRETARGGCSRRGRLGAMRGSQAGDAGSPPPAAGDLLLAAGFTLLYFAKLRPDWEAGRAELARSALADGCARDRALARTSPAPDCSHRSAGALHRRASGRRRPAPLARRAPPAGARRSPADKPAAARPRGGAPCTCDPHDPLCGCFR